MPNFTRMIPEIKIGSKLMKTFVLLFPDHEEPLSAVTTAESKKEALNNFLNLSKKDIWSDGELGQLDPSDKRKVLKESVMEHWNKDSGFDMKGYIKDRGRIIELKPNQTIRANGVI